MINKKLLIRLAATFHILTFSVMIFLNLANIDPKVIEDLQSSNPFVGGFATVLGLFGPISILAIWILMLYHWGTNQFKSGALKKLWLFLLLFGNVLSAIVYYFVVFEFHRTLKKNSLNQESQNI